MDDVISVFSSPVRHPSPSIDLGIIEITDSEPEDLGNDHLIWAERKKESIQVETFSHSYKRVVKKDSPMDVDVPTTVAGPSSHSPTPDPFPDAPGIAELDPPVIQEAETDPYSKHLALILEVVPDVLPQRALELIEELYPAYGDQVGEWVVQNMLDDSLHPKVEDAMVDIGKGKRKASELEGVVEEPLLRIKIDFASVDRPKPAGENYRTVALKQLYTDFPYVPVSHIRRCFASNNGLYIPTHFQLTAEVESDAPPFKPKAIKTSVSTGKGKRKEIQDEDFEKERAWLLFRNAQVAQDASSARGSLPNQIPVDVVASMTGLDLPPEEECSIECGCCFSSAPFQNMIQCPDAHLFCTECMVTYASNLLGEHNFMIVCMDQSGCKLLFPESELRRFLTPKLLSLYEKVKQAKEIQMAGLDGLEECPHCDFKVVIENPFEKLFRCQNEECGAVTCRECKRQDHLPRSCVEADEDKRIDARHVVEEAMTNALLRNCPSCNKVFIKESGCNKMTCPNCRTLSCYVCRKIITGYEHFNDSRPGQPQRVGQDGKCLLWDKVEERHEKEVEEAQKKAIAEYQREHPEMGGDALKIELPKATGETSGSAGQRRQPHRPPRYQPIHPLHPAQDPRLNLFRQLLGPAQARDPEVNLPQPQQVMAQVDPAAAEQHPREAQEAPQQRQEDPERHREGNWLLRRRLAQQQRVLTGRFLGPNLRDQRPAALLDGPVNPLPLVQEDGGDGAKVDPIGGGQIDRWRMAVDPQDGAIL